MKPKHCCYLSVFGAILFTANPVQAADNNLLFSDAFGSNSFSTSGLPQQETATAAGTITTAGSLAVTITSATVAGSPLVINVPVALGDTASTWSPKVVAALNATPAITARFSAGGTAPAIVLTGNPASPLPLTDATLNIEIANGTAAGITPVVTSANTRNTTPAWTDGLAPGPGNSYFTGAYVLRTPTADANVIFLGDSLNIGPALNDAVSFHYKIVGNRTVTINNLILNGGILNNGEGSTTFTLAGNVNVTAPSGLRIQDSGGRTINVTAPISGASRLYVGSNATPQANTFILSGDNNAFSGGFSLGGTYTDNGVKTFNASTATLRVNHANALGTGTLELNAGTLNLNGFSPTLTTVTVPDAGSGTIRTAGNILTATSLNLGTTTGVTLKIDNAGLANPTTAPISSTTLTVNGPSTLGVIGTGLAVGTFPLISHTGAIAGTTGFGDLTLSLPPGVTGNLVDNTNSLDVNISGIEFIKWTGAINGNWNINSGDTNWKTTVGLADTTYQQNAAGGHSVLFNESEAAISPVAIAITAAVSPNAITINNPTKDYTFSGQAITGTAAFVKDGAGTVTFSNTLGCTGGITINAGKVVVNATPAGTTAAPVTVNVTGGTLEYNKATQINQGANSYTGAGTFLKTGAGTLLYDGSNSMFAMAAGALIDVQGGKIQFGNWNATGCSATANQSDMNIAANAIFDGYSANVAVDKLTGTGTYQAGYYGPRSLTVGVAGGSSTFGGTIKGNGVDGNSQTQLIKKGNGTITLTGKVNARGAYDGSSVEVRGGTTVSPSTLILSPADPLSSTGYTTGGIYISPGNVDVSVLEQTAGTLVGNLIAVGEYGQGTFNLTGGTVNAGRIEFAWNGGGNNGPAVMNISGSAVLNVNTNGQILMGNYWGRQVTINQTGGQVVQFSDAGVTRGGTGKMNFNGGNQNLTWNLSGGTLSIAGMGWAAAGGGAGGGNGVLNLNGGILQITNAAFAAPTGDINGKPKVSAKVLGDDLTPDSGARFDNYGLNITFAAPVQHGGASVFDGGLSLATSVPGGSLTLTGINTYTGDTTVAADNTFVLADNAELAILVDGSEATKITGAGTATIAGDFRIDTTYANTTPGSEWTLVDVASRSFDPVTFQVIGFTESGNVWTKTSDGNKWTFTESTGKLSVAVAPPGFETWVSTPAFGLTVGQKGASDDPDLDGMENLLEYVLNGDPSVSDPSILPDVDHTTDPLNLVFTFTRREESATDTVQVFEYGTDLGIWNQLNITGAPGAGVTIGAASGGLQFITVKIPKSAAGSGGKLFGRLNTTKP